MKVKGKADAFGYIVDCFADGTDDRFTLIQLLEEAIDELKKNPKECLASLQRAVSDTKAQLEEDSICPECGERLVSVATGEDTYVPYGATVVSLHDGYRTECERCGYISELQ